MHGPARLHGRRRTQTPASCAPLLGRRKEAGLTAGSSSVVCACDRLITSAAGIGYKLDTELAEHGLQQVSDLARAGRAHLVQLFGERLGAFLHEASNGQVLPQPVWTSGCTSGAAAGLPGSGSCSSTC